MMQLFRVKKKEKLIARNNLKQEQNKKRAKLKFLMQYLSPIYLWQLQYVLTL